MIWSVLLQWPLGARYYVSQSQRASGLWGGPGLSGRVEPYWLGGSRYQPRRGTTHDDDLVVLGVHALQSWSIYIYRRFLIYGHSYDLRFPWLVSGVISSLPLGSYVYFWLWPMRQGMSSSRPFHLESVRVVRCVWWDGRMCVWDGLKVD